MGMAGNCDPFVYWLRQAVLSWAGNCEARQFRYVEIGIGPGITLRTVARLLASMEDLDAYECYGVDIGGLNTPGAKREFYDGRNVSLHFEGSESFLRDFDQDIDYLFIDGCHGYPCVLRDFVLAEPLMAWGSIVCFHDAGWYCQGVASHDHCDRGVEVRKALADLRLLGRNAPRSEWTRHVGTDFPPNSGMHGCEWFERSRLTD